MKKVLSLFLTLALLCALLPAARAAGTAWDGSVDISWYDPDASEYYISTPAQLAGLAALVNGMTDPAAPRVIGNTKYQSAVYTGITHGENRVSHNVKTDVLHT